MKNYLFFIVSLVASSASWASTPTKVINQDFSIDCSDDSAFPVMAFMLTKENDHHVVGVTVSGATRHDGTDAGITHKTLDENSVNPALADFGVKEKKLEVKVVTIKADFGSVTFVCHEKTCFANTEDRPQAKCGFQFSWAESDNQQDVANLDEKNIKI